MMEIVLNGKSQNLAGPQTVAQLLDEMGVPQKFTAVELNGELIDKRAYDRALADGDRLEVVRFVGGG